MKIQIDDAITILQRGELVAIPTETVYGLAAWLGSKSALDKVFQTKKRPSTNPLILHVASLAEVSSYVTILPPNFEVLGSSFWPGPLTMVLPIKEEKIPTAVRAGLPTAAFRIPKHKETIKLLQKLSPLVAPSANLSGKPSATKPEHVEADFGVDFPVLDGGSCLHGVESTIIIYQEGLWQIVRKGAISQEELGDVLGYYPPFADAARKNPICPGQLFKHYAPRAKLTLSRIPYAFCQNKKPVVVGFTDRNYPEATKLYCLGKGSAPEEVAFNLYDILRSLDKDGVEEAWVDMDMPTTGLWRTIQERLTRAAQAESTPHGTQEATQEQQV